ncbi:MAG: GNAT family N-acetyltransferase [Clostridium sp.]|nr:GNAT family N-acetyltransferase [Clostridium sp.]
MDYELAKIEDLESICDVVQHTIKTVYSRYYPVEVVDFFCELHNRDAIIRDIENGCVGVLRIEGEIVATGSFTDNHITRIYVLPEHQKKGYGTFIINRIEAQISRNYDKAYLEASLPAAGLYEKLGYSTIKPESCSVKNEVVLVYEVMEKKFCNRFAGRQKCMDAIKLVRPSAEYTEDLMGFKQEILLANDDDSFAGCSHLGKCETIAEWLDGVQAMENTETCPEGFVTSNTYLAVRLSDGRIVGIIDLRHHIDHPLLGLWGGHIGYSIRPSERGKGYAKEMLRLDLEKCRERGMDRVMVTCHPDNVASIKTIIANGGIYEKDVHVDGEVIQRYWIEVQGECT